MDGFELIETVRSDPRYGRLPIIVLSGDTDPSTPERVRRLGANAFFSKPYSPAEVRNKVKELVNAHTL
jgi:CheY-like chemotaxis protein